MQFPTDLICSKCEIKFDLASKLLQHYATHVLDDFKLDKKKKMPKLYPIGGNKQDNESDSGVEDLNPLTMCMVTMDENSDPPKSPNKKYECQYCPKKFGWSTDLKRHILLHTGERPFKCDSCQKSFTRNFLLQNHLRTAHQKPKTNLPPLKPICTKKVKTNVIKT